MKVNIWNLFYIIASLVVNLPSFAEDDSVQAMPEKYNIVLYDEIIINRSVQEVWPELLNFVSWYFAGHEIKRIKGESGTVGYTLLVGESLRHEIVSVRHLKSVVWKSCLIASCIKDYVFSDFRVDDIEKKTKFSMSNYSQQGFWGKETAKQVIQDQSKGRTPDFFKDISLKYKVYMETKLSRN